VPGIRKDALKVLKVVAKYLDSSPEDDESRSLEITECLQSSYGKCWALRVGELLKPSVDLSSDGCVARPAEAFEDLLLLLRWQGLGETQQGACSTGPLRAQKRVYAMLQHG
jgi:hypothetical protein